MQTDEKNVYLYTTMKTKEHPTERLLFEMQEIYEDGDWSNFLVSTDPYQDEVFLTYFWKPFKNHLPLDE